jgi:two-component system NtrC family sensor kinase
MSDVSERPRTVTISSTCDDRSQVEVAVIDVGSGIDPKHRDRIFDPFFTTKEKGTGLGLSVVYGIIENLGGKFEIASRAGEGTTVRIRLPLVPAGTRVA